MAMEGAVMGMAGGVLEGMNASKKANFEAKVLQSKAKIADKNAEIVAKTAGRREDAQRRANDVKQGMSYVAMGESGTGDDGTASLVLAQNATEDEANILEGRYSGMIEMTNFQNEAQDLRVSAKAKKVEGKNAMIGGILKGATSMMGAFS